MSNGSLQYAGIDVVVLRPCPCPFPSLYMSPRFDPLDLEVVFYGLDGALLGWNKQKKEDGYVLLCLAVERKARFVWDHIFENLIPPPPAPVSVRYLPLAALLEALGRKASEFPFLNPPASCSVNIGGWGLVEGEIRCAQVIGWTCLGTGWM